MSGPTTDSRYPPVRGEVAIIGLACTYPGARRMEQFWQNIVDRFDAIADVDPEHWDPEVFFDEDPTVEDRLYSKKGGWLPTTFAFNPLKFGIPPATVTGSEPDQFLLLRCAFEALMDAGYLERDFDRHRVSIIAGRGNYPGPGQTWLLMRTVVESVISIMRSMRPDLSEEKLQRLRTLLKAKIPRLTPDGAGGIIPNITTGRAANRFDFMGQNFSVDAACASSLIAAEIAVRNLLTGVDDMTLVGGLHICSQVPFLSIFKVTRATSLSSVVRPFDENADGTLSGEGVGMLVFKRLADAERDGDRIYAVIKGVGSASDGRAMGVLTPRVEGEILAIRRALEMAEVAPETIGLVECHGTATVVGDATEIQALETAYGSAGIHGQTCAIGSVKSMIGHTMPAAGAASLIKTALALYQRVVPPTLNVTRPHPRLLDAGCRFYVNTETKPWIQRTDGPPRRAGINAFGFGGINVHVVMEEYVPSDEQAQPSHLREWPAEVVIVQGATRAGLLQALDSLREYAIRVEGVALRDVAFTLNTSLEEGYCRVALVVSSLEDLAQKIDRVKLRLADPSCTQIRERSGITYFENPELRTGKLALLFPGEGAQYLNMMTDLCVHFPEVRRCFDLGDAAVKDPSRTPLSALLYPPPAFSESEEQAAEDRLWSLEHGTETVLTADLAMLALTRSLQIRPAMMAGHSVGDWLALTASGILDTDEMIGSMDRLDRIYQKLKQDIRIPQRAMLAVGVGRERMLELAGRFNCPVEIANDNCPHQVVVVADQEASQAFMERLLKEGVFVERLPYDAGYHTASFTYMNEPLLSMFRDYSLQPANVPVYCGMTAEPWPEDPGEIRTVASSAYSQPILFTQTIERMYEDGARIFVEAGPRGNLTAFVDDILRGKPHLSVPLDLFRRPGLTTLNHAVGMLAAAHVPMDLRPLYQRRTPRKLTMKFDRDSVAPEDREPGVIKVSKVYRYLYAPEGDEFPMPGPEPQAVSVTPTHEPLTAANHAGSGALAQEMPEEMAEMFAPFSTNGALSGASAPAYGSSAPVSVIEDHFRVMEDFLRTQEEIMGQFLGVGNAHATGEPHGSPSLASPLNRLGSPLALPPQAPPPQAPPPQPAPPIFAENSIPAAPIAATPDVRHMLMQVISDRTGYSPEMLDLDHDMEADLGIDSIKRVEIFSALRQLGGDGVLAGQGDMEAVAKLKTLRQVLVLLEKKPPAVPGSMPTSPSGGLKGPLIRLARVKEHTAESLILGLDLDLNEHLYLRDHSLSFPATEYDNQAGRICKMPLTCIVETSCEAAALLEPGRIVVSVSAVDIYRALQVVEGETPPPVDIVVTRQAPGEVLVRICSEDGKPYSQATVHLASGFSLPPQPLDDLLQNPRPPLCTGREIYTQRHMFHGPAFHGVSEIETMADNGILATLKILPFEGLIQSDAAPKFHLDPFLLDAAGQLVGYWPIENCSRGANILPIKIRQVVKFAENPPPGTQVQCRMRVRSLTDQTLRADSDVLLPDGRLWLRVIGWEDWRLYWPARLFDYAYGRFARFRFASIPVRNTELQAADFDCMVLPPLSDHEKAPLLNENWSYVLFGKRELGAWQKLSSRQQYESLFTYTGAKDAVRAFMTRKYGRNLFPADIEVETEDGRWTAGGKWSKDYPAPHLSCFYVSGWSVAVAGSRPCAVSAIGEREAIPAGYFMPDEEERLSRLPVPDDWKRRAAIAKQAAGRYLRPDAEENFWQTLLITKIDSGNGTIRIADPGSAVNAEDALSVIVTREEDYLIAVAFQS